MLSDEAPILWDLPDGAEPTADAMDVGLRAGLSIEDQ